MVALSGCGGGGGSASPNPNPSNPTPVAGTSVVVGVASKGPINTGSVKVFAIRDGVVDASAAIGEAQTDTKGNYSIDLGAYKGSALVEVSGGTFTDEVSGTTVTLKSPMHAVFSNISTGTQKVAVTPLTELASRRARGHSSITKDVINESNKSVASTFALDDIISTLPSAEAGDDNQKKYAASCGTFSQLANDRKGRTGESLDDALKGVMDDFGKEAEATGLSSTTVAQIQQAETEFNTSGKNTTGVAAPVINPTNGTLKIKTQGSATVGALDMTVTLPAGVEVAADPVTGEAVAAAVAASGVAAKNTLVSAKVTAASGTTPATVHIIMINANGFGEGECVTIDFKMAAGATFPASADSFTVAGVSGKNADGTNLLNVTVTPSGLGAL
jgi:hypothetical protein